MKIPKVIWTPDLFGWRYELKRMPDGNYKYWSPILEIHLQIIYFGANPFYVIYMSTDDYKFEDSGYSLEECFATAQNEIEEILTQARSMNKTFNLKSKL